ncbi:SUMF1/EgtB/PvdO family nonheme iron enzyme [Haliscomenobacter hydrossis]|uniref:Sulphatase-modifying factor protein n=1 Tax=Haliscomenobacter hydrossis (strain ATCC 27775 / DSM 1100 / LMG 10767 / O) TaxID=760192 RepID=F4KX60_HALH1|nr:SUMF1/EgtB/PvdO family nonheme iron enzyme [Haliscomenobacter hydrossis]AEE48288.1 Sulphatase-modifying factor protein [Haliscomenobacter hydrossis DSM 1100]
MKSSTLNTTPFCYPQSNFWRGSLALLLLFWSTLMSAQDPISPVTESLKPNVVAIKASFADGTEEKGFGFITAEQNGRLFLATAAHVVRGPDKDKSAQHIRVKFLNDISWYPATFKAQWDKEDLALLELPKPSFVQWQPNCADFAPGTYRKVHFIGLNGNEPRWVDPGLDGNIFEDKDHELNFAIGTIRPGTSGAPLITEMGIVGLITQDEGGISTALKLTQIKTLFSGGGQYPYFALQLLGGVVTPPPINTNVPVNVPQADEYGLVLVKGGTFTMGCTSEQGSDCYDDEKTTHRVILSDFHIGKYEVTQAQWRKVMGSDPPNLYFKGCDQCPVEGVSWEDIQKFLRKLNAQTGKIYRLPTEAEWEYAARGGNQSKGYKYAGSNSFTDVAWFEDNSGNKPHPVGTKKANELGLYDMSGNVWEWCQDWYSDYSSNTQTNPTGAGSGSYRVYRGGNWFLDEWACRVSYRNYSTSGAHYKYLGFRLAL